MPLADDDSYTVIPYVTILEDRNNEWSIEDVASDAFFSQFLPAKQSYLNFGYSDSTFWIRLQVRYKPTRKGDPSAHYWYYEVGKAQIDEVELFIQRADGTISRAQADIRIPYQDRPLRLVTSVFPIETPKGDTLTLYLRVKNSTALYFPLNLWNPREFVRKISREEVLYGLFYGGMIIMIMYNLFLFVVVRDMSYIYYSGYLFSALIMEAIEMGHGAAWIENGRTWFNKQYLPQAIWCAWLFAIPFAQNFLEIPKRHPLLNQFINPLFVFSLIGFGLSFVVPFKESLLFSVNFCSYASGCMPLLGAYMWFAGNKNASYFTLAWLFNVSGFIALTSVATGRAPATPLLVAWFPLGTWIEAVMLSFALAERIKTVQKDALRADRMAIQHLAGYRSLFDNALEGIYQINLNGKLIDANPAMAKLLGFASVQALLTVGKKSILQLFDDPARQWRELRQGKSFRNEIQHVDQDGNTTMAIHSVRLVRDTHGRPSYIEGKLINITERFQREQAERDRAREHREKLIAEAATQAKSRFLKNMSFEIRSSLTPIIGYSETLREPVLFPEQKRAAIVAITANAQSLLQLVNDILDYSKIEAGKMPLEYIDIDLPALIRSMENQFTSRAAAKNLQLDVHYDWPLPPRVVSDPTRLKQILHSLCGNAINHTFAGRIVLRVFWDEPLSRLGFAVTDTGPEISSEELRLLRDKSAVVEATDGLQRGGLGLAIARQLTRLLGGDMQVKSSPDTGNEFRISIPCKTPPRDQWLLALPTAKTNTGKSTLQVPQLSGRVLLAEDNPVNQKLIARIIAKTGAEVTVVADGEQALHAALENPFDVVLMDVNMPVMGGLEATQSLRNRGYTLPIYALTAEHGSEEIRASMMAGCNGHLTKPIDIGPFYQVLSQCLPPGKAAP